MCGLCGWIGAADISKEQRLKRSRALEGLLVANSERGKDASGVCMFYEQGKETLYKRAVPSTKLVHDEALHAITRAPDATIAIGHTRLGTMGENVDKNAHPFTENHIIGAHNGMVYNYNELEYLTAEKRGPVRVDSQVIFRMLSEIPSEGEAIAEMLPMIHGSLALTWVDTREPTVLWAFKHSNPLSIVVVDSARTAFWSSEYRHLATVMQTAYGDTWWSVKVEEDTLYRFYWENDSLMFQEWDVDMPFQSWNGGDSRKWKKDYKKPSNSTSLMSVADVIDAQFPMNTSVKELDSAIRSGGINWDESLDGCALCHDPIDWENEDAVFHQDGEGHMLCGPCDRWWESYGKEFYRGDLENAIAIKETNGTYKNVG